MAKLADQQTAIMQI